MNKQNPEALEKFVHETLRGTAAPRAPFTLEQRVLAQLARQAEVPWWKQSFHSWPKVAQLAFLVVSAAIVGLALTVGVEWVRSGVAPSFQTWWSHLSTSGLSLYKLTLQAAHSLPTYATYTALGIGVAFFTALFVVLGCGAAAYRLLWKNA